ncbi:thermonuclease family protein [Pseudomonas sp. LA5]|uniref:thermonuclease family protein n=1 Tax=Pseudomonas sp. LA5 TaxID=3027850 RepID=UPI00235F452B|nr:thermonuclease family protein [Pseudomonas sp. LA5]
MIRHSISALLLAALPLLATAQEIDCRVVGVHDGDTLTCLTAQKQQLKIRLAEIDTPESKQPYGNRAQQSLASMVFGKDVRLDVQDTDRYGRKVARVYQGNTDVNAEQVRLGSAWVYRQYLKDRSLLTLEAEARAEKRGLWALPEAERQAPWEWRRAARDQRQESRDPNDEAPMAAPQKRPTSFSQFGSPDATGSSGSFSCDTLKSCKQMSSCAEAKFQLQQCHNSRIDGDHDGVPCEAICR